MLRKIEIKTIYLNISTDSMQIKLTFGIQGEKFEGSMGLWNLNLMPSLIGNRCGILFQASVPVANETNPEPALRFDKEEIDRLQDTECQPIHWVSSQRFKETFLQSGQKMNFFCINVSNTYQHVSFSHRCRQKMSYQCKD